MVIKYHQKNMNAEDIIKQYEPELRLVDKELENIFKSDSELVPQIGKRIIQNGGKRLRPLYLLMSSDLSYYKERPRFILASIIEAIHTASLLHDDVIDDAERRRGKQTSHSIWGNQIVILIGDFIYANALRLAVGQENLAIIESLSYAIMKMTEGEVLQLYKIADPMITEEEYMTIISNKTGALFSTACKIGGILGGLDEEKINALSSFGLKIGIVFQMSDDILDFEADEKKLGKTLGKDLEEGKITLPLIYLMRSCNKFEKGEITEIITSNNDTKRRHGDGDSNLKKILNLFDKYNIIGEAFDKANEIMDDAKTELSAFEDSEEKEAMLIMADYALKRKK